MKKVISLLLIMVLFFSGCKSTEKVTIENNDWKFSRIVESKTDKVVFSSQKDSFKYDGAKSIDISCSADNGKIIIKDNSSGNEWHLDYTENKKAKTNNTDGYIYEVTYSTESENIKGYASTGAANLNGITANDYLIVTISGYDLYFVNLEETKLN